MLAPLPPPPLAISWCALIRISVDTPPHSSESSTLGMSVPPRWLDCPRKGKVIGGEFKLLCAKKNVVVLSGKFLPFKTPLSSRYDKEIPEGNKFDIVMLLSYVEAMQLHMGLVIDLTKTDRFYDKRTLTEKGIGHYKLMCEGFVTLIH